MAKKEIAEEIVDNLTEKEDDVEVYSPVNEFVTFKSLVSNLRIIERIPASGCDYPPSQTEQIHAASISEQIRAGQGNAETPENSPGDFLFPNGRDTGVDDVPVFGDINEPASRFEQEQKFKSDLSKSVQTQIEARRRVQKESSTKTSTEPQSSQNKPSSVSEDLKGNGGTTADN